MNHCRYNPTGVHRGCANVTCPECGSASCCWCGDAKPGTTRDGEPPCEDCAAEIKENEVVLQ